MGLEILMEQSADVAQMSLRLQGTCRQAQEACSTCSIANGRAAIITCKQDTKQALAGLTTHTGWRTQHRLGYTLFLNLYRTASHAICTACMRMIC